MWRIEEHRRVDKQIDAIPTDILKRYEKWKDIAEISGPTGLWHQGVSRRSPGG